MLIEMQTNTLPKRFFPLPISYNGIPRNTQLAAAKLHFLFGGKIPSFACAGVLGQRCHGTNLQASARSRARGREASVPVEGDLQGRRGTCRVRLRGHWKLPINPPRVHALDFPAQSPLGLLLLGKPEPEGGQSTVSGASIHSELHLAGLHGTLQVTSFPSDPMASVAYMKMRGAQLLPRLLESIRVLFSGGG
jgi:hypothetical protein